MSTPEIRRFGHTFKEHTLTVPWDCDNPEGGTFELFAREIIPPGGQDYPVIVYLQGGPGFPAPRPYGTNGEFGGVLGAAAKKYRWILLDQRGTGRSHRIDGASPEEDRSVERLRLLRQDNIVRDAEALREHLGIKRWSLFGQSFGGFCITAYVSLAPESVEHAYLTGGLPTLDKPVDELYRATYRKLLARQNRFYAEIPWARARVEEIIHHLDNSEELLPTGERLSSRRFRTIGIELGQGTGFDSLAYLLEDPFHPHGGEKRLRTDFLAGVGQRVSFADGPLYAAIHESIYGGVGGAGATNWSAQRVREEFPEFAEDGTYLTGEHIYPWQFEEDPALRPFAQGAQDLAQHHWQGSPYDAAVLADAPTTAAAAVYLDDIFVPFEESMATAATYRDLRLHVTNKYQHNGIGVDGAGIFTELQLLVDDH
ncbi:alpha/beta fold hydrolase [Corynebacterium lizhenjunii]|uniref:alpha/beta fold hydrolase n=1 Tax=Corynebacterium lizhenjunii TaxID=2709394 RepID=UPI0013EB9567|nr:alpha/beta fold hydrolase [Corynebacterium lizhenjunii]